MRDDQFMELLREWRKQPPEKIAELYLKAIPKQVQDSMAFEGDYVDLKFLEDNL